MRETKGHKREKERAQEDERKGTPFGNPGTQFRELFETVARHEQPTIFFVQVSNIDFVKSR